MADQLRRERLRPWNSGSRATGRHTGRGELSILNGERGVEPAGASSSSGKRSVSPSRPGESRSLSQYPLSPCRTSRLSPAKPALKVNDGGIENPTHEAPLVSQQLARRRR
ncbi:hypothetical protein VTN00DRAFT_8884 [Thermoascus crustaceus]|uniref:uncharacterized protein n=1 Tax=Thermoascus crustaceus TaxID=5088 RepID=UPI003743F80C